MPLDRLLAPRSVAAVIAYGNRAALRQADLAAHLAAEAMRFLDALNRLTRSQFQNVERHYASEDQTEGARLRRKARARVEEEMR